MFPYSLVVLPCLHANHTHTWPVRRTPLPGATLTTAGRRLVVVEEKLSLPESLCKACESAPADVRFGGGRGREWREERDGRGRALERFRAASIIAVLVQHLVVGLWSKGAHDKQARVVKLCIDVHIHTYRHTYAGRGGNAAATGLGWFVEKETRQMALYTESAACFPLLLTTKLVHNAKLSMQSKLTRAAHHPPTRCENIADSGR